VEEDTPVVSPPPAVVPHQPAPPIQYTPNAGLGIAVASVVAPQPVMDQELAEKMRNKLTVGPSVAESFRKILEPLGKSIVDEGTKYRTAMEIASAQNIDVRALLNSYNDMIGILDQEQAKFNKFLDNQQATEVTARQTKVAELEAQIAAKQQEIVALMGDKDQLSSDIQTFSAKLAVAKGNFEFVYNSFKGEVQTMTNKAQTFLGMPATGVKK